jgi:hypothetical protein
MQLAGTQEVQTMLLQLQHKRQQLIGKCKQCTWTAYHNITTSKMLLMLTCCLQSLPPQYSSSPALGLPLACCCAAGAVGCACNTPAHELHHTVSAQGQSATEQPWKEAAVIGVSA